jgi:hypothetical protein
MLQAQIADSLLKKIDAVYTADTLYSALKSINETYQGYEGVLTGQPEPVSNDTLSALKQAVDSIIAHLSGVSSRSLFREIDLLVNTLNDSLNIQKDTAGCLSDHIVYFSDAYDSYTRQPSRQNALKLLLMGHELYIRIQTYLGLGQSLVEAYSLSEKIPFDSEGELLMILPAVETVEEAVICLKSILSIYGEICILAGVSCQSYPLRLCKIDSGSLWVKLFGESRVMGLACKLIENAAMYAYRNYTDEGRAAAIPKKVETLKEILGLSKSLEEAGIDTSEMKEKLEKGAVSIVNEFNELIQGQKSIHLNGKEISAKTAIEALQDDGATARQLSGRTIPRLRPSADPESSV